MINLISYSVPWLGLMFCIVIIFSKNIDTKCAIRITKMCLWIIIWTLLLFYDYPYNSVKSLPIMFVRLSLLFINILYIIEAIITIRKE